MARTEDLALARKLMAASVLDRDAVERALRTQGDLLRQGRDVRLERVLYAMHLLPAESLAFLRAPPLLESQPFTDYRLETLLGEGGASTVYGGVYVPNGTPVAIKVLDPLKALRDVDRGRFLQEARLHIELEHPGVVAGYEMGREGGYDFYSMDLIEGATVLEVIDNRGALSSEEALSITAQVAGALAYLHGEDLVHRDIKPGNIMVEPDGRAQIIDMGLVERRDALADSEEGSRELTVGTVEYLSPEQARGRPDLDARADIYSLGVTLYHMVVGEVPFRGESSYEVMAKHILGTMDGQKLKQRRITPEIYFLISKMTAKDREERWGSAEEVVRVIEGYLPEGEIPVDLGTPPAVDPVMPQESAPPAVDPVTRPPAADEGRRGPRRRAPRRGRRGRRR